MANTCINYQLPDLLAEFRSIPLRTNKHCKPITDASFTWFSRLGDPNITTNEFAFVNSAKFSLLAALCFPTCDSPQLRLVTDLWTLLNVSSLQAALELSSRPDPRPTSALKAIKSDDLLKNLDPKLLNFIANMPPAWTSRFDDAFSRSFTAHDSSGATRDDVADVDVDTYLASQRDLSGLDLFVTFVELVEGLGLVVGSKAEEDIALESLRRSTADIIVISWDIFSYNIDQAGRNPQKRKNKDKRNDNIVSIIMRQSNLALHAAMNQAALKVKNAFADFKEAERYILSQCDSFETESIPSPTSWNPLHLFTRTTPSPTSPSSQQWSAANIHDIKLFIQGLKDCIIGALNWGYETELFFGDKGDEIREFGWVFLAPSS